MDTSSNDSPNNDAPYNPRIWIDDDLDNVRRAFKKGFNPNYNDDDGATSLHKTAQFGSVKVLEFLVNHSRTRLLLRDHFQLTALHYAARCENLENAVIATDILLNAGCDINAVSNCVECPTALFIALKFKNERLVARLLERGANIDFVDYSQMSPLLFLMIERVNYTPEQLENLVAILLYYNVDVNYPVSVHAFTIAVKIQNYALFSMLVYYFGGIFQVPGVNQQDQVLDTMILSIQMAEDEDELLYVVDQLQLTPETIVELMLHAGQTKYPSLFYKLFSLLGDRKSTRNHHLNTFFIDNKLERQDFMNALCILLALDVNWKMLYFERCHYIVVSKYKRRLNLSLDDMETIFYLMFMISDEIDLEVLNLLAKETGGYFPELDIYMKFGVKIKPFMLHTLENGPNNSAYIREICFPTMSQTYEGPLVPSLLRISRDVIRKHIQPQRSPDYRMRGSHIPLNYFIYYPSIQSLALPLNLKDVLLLKCNI